MSDNDKGVISGIVITCIIWMLVFGALFQLGIFTQYEQCKEDEVWTWHHNEGDYPHDRRWSCVAIDDLLMEHNP